MSDPYREDDEEPASAGHYPTAPKSNLKKIVAALKAVIKEFYRTKDEERTESDFDHRWRKREVYGLWFAAFVGILAVGVTTYDAHQQRDVMQRQLGTMEADQRPWVYIVEKTPYGDFDIHPPYGVSLPVVFKLQNSGRTPAIRVHIRGHFFDRTNGWPMDLAKVQDWACNAKSGRGIGNSANIVVFPGTPQTVAITFVLGEDKLDRIIRGDKPPESHAAVLKGIFNGAIAGCVKYEFVSHPGEIHTTPFFYTLSIIPAPGAGQYSFYSPRLVPGRHKGPASQFELVDTPIIGSSVPTN